MFLRIQKREEGGVAGGEERSLRNETRRGTSKLSHQEKVFEESGEFGIAVNSVGLYNIHVPINVQYCMQCTCRYSWNTKLDLVHTYHDCAMDTVTVHSAVLCCIV